MSELANNAFETNAVQLTDGPLLIGGEDYPWIATIGEDNLPADDVPVGTFYFQNDGCIFRKFQAGSGQTTWCSVVDASFCPRPGQYNVIQSGDNNVGVDENQTETIMVIQQLPDVADPDRNWVLDMLELIDAKEKELRYEILTGGSAPAGGTWINLDPTGTTSKMQYMVDEGDYVGGEAIYIGYLAKEQNAM